MAAYDNPAGSIKALNITTEGEDEPNPIAENTPCLWAMIRGTASLGGSDLDSETVEEEVIVLNGVSLSETDFLKLDIGNLNQLFVIGNEDSVEVIYAPKE